MQQPAITVQDATLRLGSRDLWKKLSLSVAAGEWVAVLGPNGSGKSSLLKALLGFHATTGSMSVLGESPRVAGKKVGYIPQQKAFDRLAPISGRDLVQLGVNGAQWFAPRLTTEQKARIAAAIAEVGASQYADKPLGQLSGGEQQRLRIAQAIVNDPAVLFCDEPLLSLDLSSQQAVAGLVNRRKQKGAAVLFVTHEINPILPYVDRVLYLVGGKWAIGTPDEVLTSEQLTKLYSAPVEVLRIHGRIIVVSAHEHTPTELQDTHHHVHHAGSSHG